MSFSTLQSVVKPSVKIQHYDLEGRGSHCPYEQATLEEDSQPETPNLYSMHQNRLLLIWLLKSLVSPIHLSNLLRQDALLNFDLLLSALSLGRGGVGGPRPQTQWASCWSGLLIIWISKPYLDNTSFQCQIAKGSWGRLEDACMWKNHTGLIVLHI